MEPLFNGHHWDQQTCPFNRGVFSPLLRCHLTTYHVSKWDKKSVLCSEVSFTGGSTVRVITPNTHYHRSSLVWRPAPLHPG